MLMALLQNMTQLPDFSASTYTYQEMVANTALATALGVVVALVYRHTHKGLSYSQSFTQTVLFVTVIVAVVMMVIGDNLARAVRM